MKRLIAMLVLSVCVWTSAADAADSSVQEELRPEGLTFWGIGIADFYAGKPRPILVPGAAGDESVYWYWPFQFRARTNLERLREFIDEKVSEIDDRREREGLKEYVEKIDKTLGNLKAPGMYVNIHGADGEVIPNISNPVIRNLIERKLGRKLMTVAEVAEMDLAAVKESDDLDLGRGRWVNGVAIFDSLPESMKEFEIRVFGLGRRVVPTYEPGSLLYPVGALRPDEALNSSLRRCFRYLYRRVGRSAAPALDPVIEEGAKTDWVWVWSTQISAGRPRFVNISRSSDLGLERTYAYVPYWIWNSTDTPRTIEVREAGLAPEINWGGEAIALQMTDRGKADAYWKTMVMRQIASRVKDGDERSFVEENEKYPFDDGTDTAKTMIEADVKRKAAIQLADGQARLFSGEIAAGALVQGVVVVRWGPNDLEQQVKDLILRLKAQAISGVAPESHRLLDAYQAIRKPPYKDGVEWFRPAEPADDAVKALLIDIANKDLKAEGVTVSEDDRRRYGELASIGALWSHLARKQVDARAEEGFTDLFFRVYTDEVIDWARILAQFRSYLPQPREQRADPEDRFAGLGAAPTRQEMMMMEREERGGADDEEASDDSGDSGFFSDDDSFGGDEEDEDGDDDEDFLW